MHIVGAKLKNDPTYIYIDAAPYTPSDADGAYIVLVQTFLGGKRPQQFQSSLAIQKKEEIQAIGGPISSGQHTYYRALLVGVYQALQSLQFLLQAPAFAYIHVPEKDIVYLLEDPEKMDKHYHLARLIESHQPIQELVTEIKQLHTALQYKTTPAMLYISKENDYIKRCREVCLQLAEGKE